MVTFRLNLIYRPEDFSLGNFMKSQAILDNNGEWFLERVEEFKKHFAEKVVNIHNNLSDKTKSEALDTLIAQCQNELQQAIIEDSNGWKFLFPGKHLLEEYAKTESLGKPPVLQNCLIKELSANPDKIALELRQVIQTIVEWKTFK